MNDNLDMFISTHRDFAHYPTNSVYKVITDEGINISAPLDVLRDGDHEIYDRSFSYAEGSRIYWVYKNYQLKDYVGFCHYRSYFSFFNDIPDINEVFSQYKIITGYPDRISSIYEQYDKSHYISDMNNLLSVIDDDKIKNEVHSPLLYKRNMFIMRKDDFIDYCNVVFGYMLKFDALMNLKTDDDCKRLHNDIYQSRVDGFLLERLTSMYISSHFTTNEIKTYEIKMTEERFW